MAYNKHTWEYGETITASKLNNMEDGIANADTKVGDLTTDVSDLKNAINRITNYGNVVVNSGQFQNYWVNNGVFEANADSLMAVIPMQAGYKYLVSAIGNHNRFRIYVSNTIAEGSTPTEVYRSEPVHAVTGDTYEYTNTNNYTYLLCFMNYLTEQSMTFRVTESFGDETEPFTVNGVELYTKEQTDEAIENAVEGITPYRNIFDGVYVNQYPGTGGVIVDTDNARSARFNVKPNYTYHIHAVGNTNRFIVYGGQNGVFTEITRIQTADITGNDELSVTNTNYTEFLVMLYFGTGGSSFACSTTVYESQTAELHFSVNGTQVYTAEETDELLNDLKAETSEEIRDNSADKYVYSKNLYNISDSIGGYSIASATGELVELPSARSSNFIEISPYTKYTFSTKHVVAWYDENKTFISGVPSSDTALTLTSPTNAKYFRFSHQILIDEVMVNEGETALPYQPYDVCLQPEYLPPIKKYALDFSTVKYTEGITVSMNNLMLMAYKMAFGSFPNYQGFLLLDGTDNKFYFADSNMQNIKYVFDWDLSLANNVSPQDYLYTITADGDIICLRKWKRENPIIYPHTDYTSPVRVDFGNNPAPYGFLESISCVQFDDGSFVFGEYAKHSLTDEQNNDRRNIWRVTKPYTNVSNWTIAHSFKHVFYESPASDEPNNEIGHIHTVVYDFYADILYCSTGDIDRHCRVWASEDKGITWAEVASNGQKYRALGMTFTDDSAYWATDSFNANHNLWKVNRDANGELDFSTLTMLCSLEPSSRRSGTQATTGSQATYGMILMREPYGILMLERAEPRSDNKLDILFYSLENEKLYTVATLGKADDLASLVEPNRNGLCNQCFTDYQPDTCGYALTGGGQMVRPNTTDVLHNSSTNYIGVLKLKVIEKVNQ